MAQGKYLEDEFGSFECRNEFLRSESIYRSYFQAEIQKFLDSCIALVYTL